MQKGSEVTVVTQKGDDEVVAEGEKIHGIAEEVGDPIIWGDEGEEQELEDVEEEPDGEVCTSRDLGPMLVGELAM